MCSPFFNGFRDVGLSKFGFWVQTFLSCAALQSDTKEINSNVDRCMKLNNDAVQYVVLDISSYWTYIISTFWQVALAGYNSILSIRCRRTALTTGPWHKHLLELILGSPAERCQLHHLSMMVYLHIQRSTLTKQLRSKGLWSEAWDYQSYLVHMQGVDMQLQEKLQQTSFSSWSCTELTLWGFCWFSSRSL